MKRRILSVLTVLVLAAMLCFAVSATSSMMVVPGDADLTSLDGGDTFDVYIIVSPFNGIGTSATQNYIYRVPEDAKYGTSTAPAATHNTLNTMLYTLTWNKSSLEVASVTTYGDVGNTVYPSNNTDVRQAVKVGSTTYYYAYMAKTAAVNLASVVAPTVTGVGTGTANTGTLTIGYGTDKTGGFMVRNQAKGSTVNGVVAKVTFRVPAGASAGTNLAITLNNTYKVNTTGYDKNAANITVTVNASCAHTSKVALSPAELTANGKENVTVSCQNDGVTWYRCTSTCGEIFSVNETKLPHKYTVEKYLDGKAPTCIVDGEKALFCSYDGCSVYDVSSVTKANRLGHDIKDANYAYLAPDCTNDGYEIFWCETCKWISPDKNVNNVISTVFENGEFKIGNGVNAGQVIETPESVKIAALGHDFVMTRMEGNTLYYECSRVSECNVPTKVVTAEDMVRYVSNNGGGDGLSASSPAKLDEALKSFSDLPSNLECIIYLTEDIDLYLNAESRRNTAIKNFEEAPHKATVVYKTAPGASSMAKILFPFATTSMYFLNGPTVFDNIVITGDTASDDKSDPSISIYARGFDIRFTENFQTYGVNGGTFAYSKNGGSYGAHTNITMNIPNCKLYLMGGTYTNGFYDGQETVGEEINMYIEGGTFFVVTGTVRTAAVSAANNTVNIHVGNKAKIGQLIPSSIAPSANVEGLVANVHYYAGFECVLAYRVQNNQPSGNYTVNHFFHKGCGNIKIGDFMMGNAAHAKNVNAYYYEFDNTVVKNAMEFDKKSKRYEIEYKETQEFMSFTEWCIAHGGGHDFEDGICTFCDVEECDAHKETKKVLVPSTCQTAGKYYLYCSDCYERLSEIVDEPLDPEAHGYYWDLTVSPIVCRCEYESCGKVLCSYDITDVAELYVSDNGYANGGFSADYPLNDFNIALSLAALLERDVTINIVGGISVYDNYTGESSHTVFVEPKHEYDFTIKGYKSQALFKFGSTTEARILYNLNGNTKFENIEFTEFSGNNPANSNIYLIASHNHLTLGENISADFARNSGSTTHNGRLVIIGGCYHTDYTVDVEGGDGTKCEKTDTHVTIQSGTYYDITGGSAGIGCGLENGTITFDIVGDFTVQDYFVAGSYQKPAGDIVINFNGGNVATGAMFSISGYNGAATNYNSGDVKDVTIKLYDGSVISNSFQASQSTSTLRPVGATYNADENGIYDVTAHLDTLTICYNPANGPAKTTANLFRDSYHSKTVVFNIIGNDYCGATVNGAHVKGETVEEVASVCAKQGYGIYECTACGEEYVEEFEIVEHTFGDIAVASDANCINPEILKEVCEVCGFIEYTVGDVAATGEHSYDDNGICVYCTQSRQDLCEHVWDDGAEVTTGCGLGVLYTCVNECGATKIETVGTDHNYGKFTITVQPTATEPGIKVRSCKSCGKVDTALLYAAGNVGNTEAIAVDASGNIADVAIASSKLSKAEKAALNALIQETAYGSEIKVSYNVDGSVANITYSIPLPAEFAEMQNIKVVVKDDEGKLHMVEFTVEKGFIVFTF